MIVNIKQTLKTKRNVKTDEAKEPVGKNTHIATLIIPKTGHHHIHFEVNRETCFSNRSKLIFIALHSSKWLKPIVSLRTAVSFLKIFELCQTWAYRTLPS
jgi:hypothetical protein